ncbi:MAG: helix-turn-helix domain-containing protein [Pseudomonadota bacterium]
MLKSFNTSIERKPNQFAYWREELCNTFIGMNATKVENRAFSGSLLNLSMPELCVSRVTADRHCIERTQTHIRNDEGEWLFVNLQLAGSARTEQGDNRFEAKSGDIVFVDTRKPYSIDLPTAFDLLCFKVPIRQMRKHTRDVTFSNLPTIPHTFGLAPILKSYVGALVEEGGKGSIEAGHIFAENLVSLLCCGLKQSQPNSKSVNTLTTQQAARFNDLDSYISANICNPSLGLASITAELGISKRYVQKLFAAQSTTLSKTILEKRLRGAAETLSDPSRSSRVQISEIAYAWGFSDLSYFSKRFRETFGRSPQIYRKQNH